MKMKKLAVSMLSVGLVMSLIMSSTEVFASENEDAPQADSSAESDVKVQFTVPDEVDSIIYDPHDPQPGEGWDEEDLEEKGHVTNHRGTLTLDYVRHLDFGTAEISAESEKYIFNAESDPHLQLTDRRGTGAGWNVQAKLQPFKKVDENGEVVAEQSLVGSALTLSGGDAVSPVDGSIKQKPSVKEYITLSSNEGSQLIASAKSQGTSIDTAQGVGTWLIRWLNNGDSNENEKVTLEVPARSASVGNHKAVIEWTLSDGPYGN